MVPIGEHAGAAVGGEVFPQPRLLRRAGFHRDVRVQRVQPPGAECVGVVTALPIPGEGSEVVEIRSCARLLVVVIPGRWPRDRLVPPPGGLVEARVVRGSTTGIGVVSGRVHHVGLDLVEQLRGPLRVEVGGGDVARSSYHRPRSEEGSGPGKRPGPSSLDGDGQAEGAAGRPDRANVAPRSRRGGHDGRKAPATGRAGARGLPRQGHRDAFTWPEPRAAQADRCSRKRVERTPAHPPAGG